MKTLIINGSPKVKNSGSEILINKLRKYIHDASFDEIDINIKNYKENFSEKINNYNKIVLFFPLYADGLPSHLLEAMENLSKRIKNNIEIYSVVNCGLIEGIHTKQGLGIIENFSEATGNTYMGGIGIGGCGGLFNMKEKKILKFVDRNINKALKLLSDRLQKDEELENTYTSINFPRWLYRIAAGISWKKDAKKYHINLKKDTM